MRAIVAVILAGVAAMTIDSLPAWAAALLMGPVVVGAIIAHTRGGA
jgi:hypothetical protein